MGIFIRPTQEKKIKISGTDIELNEVYGRIDFVGRQDGRNLEIATTTYVVNKPIQKENQFLQIFHKVISTHNYKKLKNNQFKQHYFTQNLVLNS